MKITENLVNNLLKEVNDLLGKQYSLVRLDGIKRLYTIHEVNDSRYMNAFNMNLDCSYSLKEMYTAIYAVLYALYKLKSGVLTLNK